MVKRIQCFLSDDEASFVERAKGILAVESDYALVKLAIQELCHRCGADRGCEPTSTARANEVQRLEPKRSDYGGYVAVAQAIEAYRSAKFKCAKCGLHLPENVEYDECPRCGGTEKVRL